MKKIYIFFALITTLYSGYSQEVGDTKAAIRVKEVNTSTLKEIAAASPKKYTLFYTFGIWCEPCRLHLPTAIKLAKDYDLDFYVIVVDASSSDSANEAFGYLSQQDEVIKIAVLSDEEYGEKTRKRNKKFVREITPPQFETIEDYSKYILLNQSGEVIMVTNYKDNNGNDWRDDSKMVQQRIVPLLK